MPISCDASTASSLASRNGGLRVSQFGNIPTTLCRTQPDRMRAAGFGLDRFGRSG